MRTGSILRLTVLISAALFVLIFHLPGHAAVFTVDTVSDDPAATSCSDTAPNDCSLRGAIIAANGLSEPSTINIPPGTYVLQERSDCFFGDPFNVGTFLFPTTSLCVSKSVTLVGAGPDTTVIDGNQVFGVSGVAAPVPQEFSSRAT